MSVRDNLIPILIGLMLLILNFTLYFAVNGIFYSDSYISSLFHSTKPEKFFTYFPRSLTRMVYTSIVGVFISYIIECFFIEEKKIRRIFLKFKNDQIQLKYQVVQLINMILRRLKFFIAVSYGVIVISWIYVSSFNYVYPYTKIEWIKSSVTIFLIMQFFNVFVCFCESCLRTISFLLKSEKIYKISKSMN